MAHNNINLPFAGLANGAVQEKLNGELQKIFDNIHDNNTKATDKRSVTIKLEFIPDDEREILLQVLGNIKEENVRTVGDDGISQAVKIKQGLTSVADVIVPNPVNLAPYRTFLEVDQPFSNFIFRMKDGPKGALFEADGGVWRNDAITNIANYLHDRLIGEPAERGEEPFNVTIIA